MAIIAIILQAFAGIIYGVSHIVGAEKMDEWRESKKDWFANNRNRVRVSYWLTFVAPLALVIYAYTLEGNDIQWYYLLLGFICSWAVIVLLYTSFLLAWSRSKSIADLIRNPRVSQMVRKSNAASLAIGVMLMILGGFGVGRLSGLVIGNGMSSAVLPIILFMLALAALYIGFVLVLMPAVYYLCVLFVTGVSMLLRPRKAIWIFALSLFLVGCVLLGVNEIYKPG